MFSGLKYDLLPTNTYSSDREFSIDMSLENNLDIHIFCTNVTCYIELVYNFYAKFRTLSLQLLVSAECGDGGGQNRKKQFHQGKKSFLAELTEGSRLAKQPPTPAEFDNSSVAAGVASAMMYCRTRQCDALVAFTCFSELHLPCMLDVSYNDRLAISPYASISNFQTTFLQLL